MKRLLLLLVFSVLAGCGTSYYDTLYDQNLKQLESASRFSVLWPGASEIPGTNLVIRLPKIFEKVYNKNSIYSDDPHGDIDPERLNPPFLNPFPGLINCYEVFQKDPAGTSLPVYLYTGVRVLSAEGKAALQQQLQAMLQALSPGAAWSDVQARSPIDTPVAWKKIEATMPQEFFPSGQGKTGAQKLPGVFELWWYDTPTGVLLLGCARRRMPSQGKSI